MSEESNTGCTEDRPRRTLSVTRKIKTDQGEPSFVKNIPSYISCIITTSSNFLICLMFSVHSMYYFQMNATLAAMFVLAVTSITFVGTFKAIL